MKTSNYLAKLPQEATIKSIQVPKEALRLFLVFLLKSPVFFNVSPVYFEELLSFLVSP